MERMIKRKSLVNSPAHQRKPRNSTSSNVASISPRRTTEKNAPGNSNFQGQQRVKFPEIPSVPTSNDFEFKPLIRKALFKPYMKESLSPIKNPRGAPALSENDFKEITHLIRLMTYCKK